MNRSYVIGGGRILVSEHGHCGSSLICRGQRTPDLTGLDPRVLQHLLVLGVF